jgi:ubiquinone/menaquinone biosynthesis C-methylase UbiE
MIRTDATSAASGAAIEFVVCGDRGRTSATFQANFARMSGHPPNLCDPICARGPWEAKLREPLSAASERKPNAVTTNKRRKPDVRSRTRYRDLSAWSPRFSRCQPRQTNGGDRRCFFLPFLKPGMRLLDVGCGPGSITAGLAKRAEPAETIGIDPSPSVIETARSLAEAKAGGHLTFEAGNIYEPCFAPETFEAIFAHQVLQHLGQPVDALRQIRKLLAPGGVVGVRDVDWGSTTFYPENQGMRRFLTLYCELARRNGGEPNAGRHMRRWFREAGFAEARVTTSTVSYTDQAATGEWGDTYAERTLYSNLADKALEFGIATRPELEEMAAAWRVWGRDPDALFCFSHTEVVAWKR